MAFPQQFLTVIDQPEGATLELVAQDGNHQSVPLVPVTSVLPALSAFWWVDAASTATTPDGSEARPYPTVDAAVAAAAAALITNLTLYLVPGDYPATTINSQTAGLARLTLGSPGVPANGAILLSVTWTPVTAGGSQLTLQGVGVQGLFVSDDAAAASATLNVDGANVGVFTSAGNTTVVATNNSTVGGDNTSQMAGLVARDSFVIVGVVGAGGIQAWDSDIEPTSVLGNTTLVGCDIIANTGSITLAGGAQINIWSGCTFNGASNVTFTAPGLLFLDGQTNYWHTASASGLVNGQIIVTERPERATISVAVPALATDELGYFDVSTVGTPLAGLVVGDLVGFNPLADVEAAGAGNGGPTFARVSANDTIRLAFMGATTAHAVDFVFYKI